MSFASPGYLALLAVAPLAAAAYLSLDRWRRRAAGRFAPGQDLTALSPNLSPGRRALKAALLVLAIAAVALALARPRFGQHEMVVEQGGADVVIALDVSRSMFADDVAPSRLALAQRETLTLLDRLRGHRVGLVIFARSALLRSPLTTDVTPLRTLVQSAGQDSILLDPGSDLGAAVGAAARALGAGEAQSQAIVLVSDGEDHEGRALSAARDAADQGMLLLVAGVGTEVGADVPLVDPTTGLPFSSQQAAEEELGEAANRPLPVTHLDEGLLRLMAGAAPGGAYLPGQRLSELANVIDRLPPTAFATDRQQQPIERFQWVVLAALALLVLEAALPERRGGAWPGPRLVRAAAALRPGRLAVLAVLGLLAVACGSTASSLVGDGNRAYERGDHQEALQAYLHAGAIAPERPEPHFNAGLALHRLERYEEAAAETARAFPIEHPLAAARAHYNLGNHYVLMSRPMDALASYRQALLLDPDDRDAKHNLELALMLIDDLRAMRPTDGGATSDGSGEEPEENEDGDGDGPGAGPPDEERTAQAEAIQRTLEQALAGIEQEFTVEEALKALDLVQELYRLLPVVEVEEAVGSADRPEY